MKRWRAVRPKWQRYWESLLMAVFVIALWTCPARAYWQPDGVPVCTEQDASMIATSQDSQEGMVVAWATMNSGRTVAVQRLDSGGHRLWGQNGVVVGGGDCVHPYPEVVSDGQGGAIVAWNRTSLTGSGVRAQRVSAEGEEAWPVGGVLIFPAAVTLGGLLPDGEGGVIVIGVNNIEGQLHAQRIRPDGVMQWGAGVQFAATGFDKIDLDVGSDGSGGTLVAWSEARISDHDIYAQRLDEYGGHVWPSGGLAICTASGNQLHVATAHEPSGASVFAWQDYRSGATELEIFAQRIEMDGTECWDPNGAEVPLRTYTPIPKPCVVSDGLGGAFIVCDGLLFGPGGDTPVSIGQHIDSFGAALWSEEGLPLLSPSSGLDNFIWYSKVVGDGAGGVFVIGEGFYAWEFDMGDITAQHVSPSGELLWGPTGVTVCSLDGYQRGALAVSDGASGALVAWIDERDGYKDVYANRLWSMSTGLHVPELAECVLGEPTPNPFRQSTEFAFDIPISGSVRVSVHDASGRLVCTVVDASMLDGRQRVTWDGRNQRGTEVASGVYFLRVDVAGTSYVSKVVRIQ